MLYSWSGSDVRPELFEEQFSDVIRSQVLTCDCVVNEGISSASHETRVSKASLGQVSVFKYSSTGIHTARRTANHVRLEASDDLLLYLPLTSSYIVRQDGRELDLRPGSVAFVTLDKPFEGTFIGTDSTPLVGANVRLPMSLVRSRLPRIEECLLGVIPLESGPGRIMLALLQSAFEEAPHLDGRAAMLVGSGIVDTICAFGHTVLGLRAEQPRRLRDSRDLTRERAEDFALAHLACADLSPGMIAERCNLSLRCLHLAFESSEWTVTAWIKEQRLLRCRADLRNPELRHRTVADIAYAWGFKDVSHFSRAYKNRFSVPPSAERLIQ